MSGGGHAIDMAFDLSLFLYGVFKDLRIGFKTLEFRLRCACVQRGIVTDKPANLFNFTSDGVCVLIRRRDLKDFCV